MGVRDRIPRMLARAADLAEERAQRERARKVVERWNRDLVHGELPLWSPSIRAALLAGMPGVTGEQLRAIGAGRPAMPLPTTPVASTTGVAPTRCELQ